MTKKLVSGQQIPAEEEGQGINFADAFKEATQYEAVRRNYEQFLAQKPSLKARLYSGVRFYGSSDDIINAGMIYRY